MSNDSDEAQEKKRIKEMTLKILEAEQKNLKTREKPNEKMVDAIRSIINDEAKKNY